MNDITEEVSKWLNNPLIADVDKEEIKKLHKDELTDRFYKDLEFGTGGIRGILGMGINRINIYSIARATQALSDILPPQSKVIICYDSRRNSLIFAKKAAQVLVGNGHIPMIFKRLNPIALLSFAIRFYKASSGIMITASHNPAIYNGYKLFWNDGAQVVPPQDQQVIDIYQKTTLKDVKEGDISNITWIGEDLEDSYINAISANFINKVSNNIKIIYTPLHGTGLIPFEKMVKALGFTNYQIVEDQKRADPNFSTVVSPNPENPSALTMAVALMNETSADLVLANDPDADRIGVAVNHQGRVFYLSGNQLGALMLNYILSNTKPSNGYFLNTIVTTRLQDRIATNFGIKTYKTLTGFKWLAAKIRELEKDASNNFIFATEESFGFLNHTFIRDKDGISPLALIIEMASLLKKDNKTLVNALWDLYQQYGYHHEELLNLEYAGIEGVDKIKKIMNAFRNLPSPLIAGEKITGKIDYLEHQDDLPKSDVLQFDFNNMHLLLRPSGTEPKIKFYLLLKEDGDLTVTYTKALERSKKFIDFIKDFADKL